MAENEKKKASLISRIASTCAFVFFMCVLLTFGAGVAGLSSGLAIVVLLLSYLFAPASGICGIVLGIVALCQLTPEEKSESLWKSGTTKNNALVGIIMPPLMTIVVVVLNLLLESVR